MKHHFKGKFSVCGSSRFSCRVSLRWPVNSFTCLFYKGSIQGKCVLGRREFLGIKWVTTMAVWKQSRASLSYPVLFKHPWKQLCRIRFDEVVFISCFHSSKEEVIEEAVPHLPRYSPRWRSMAGNVSGQHYTWPAMADMKKQLQLAQLKLNPENLALFLSHRWQRQLVLFPDCNLYFFYFVHYIAYTATFWSNFALQQIMETLQICIFLFARSPKFS